MSQTISENIIHLVFSTKHRENRLHQSIRPDLFAFLAALSETNNSHAYRVGGVENHIHIAFRLHQTLALSKYVNLVKTESSKWLKSTPGISHSFSWQNGYGAFSISKNHLPALCHYIDTQEIHHKQENFQDEFRRICLKYDVKLDERYAWD